MSLLVARRPVRRRIASFPQVVAGTLATLVALLTVQMAALTAWVDVFGGPGGLGAQQYDELGRPFTGWSQTWHEFGPLLWGVYALVLLGLVAWMWRAILTKPPRVVWSVLPVLLAVSTLFWALDLDRFSLN